MSDWANTKTRHGTQSGWSLHQSLGERPCDPCYRAKSEYDANQRSSSAAKRKARMLAMAQARAHTALVHNHPAEYREFYLAYKAKLEQDGTP